MAILELAPPWMTPEARAAAKLVNRETVRKIRAWMHNRRWSARVKRKAEQQQTMNNT